MVNGNGNETELYKNMWEMRKRGFTPSVIAQELNKVGLRTKKGLTWNPTRVSNVLQWKCKPIVSREEYQSMMNRSGVRKVFKRRVVQKPKVVKAPRQSKITDANLVLEILTHRKIPQALALEVAKRLLTL